MRVFLKQYTGINQGVIKPEPIDWIMVERADGVVKPVGMIARKDNARVVFTIRLAPSVFENDRLREEIRQAVAKLRKAEGQRIWDTTASVPDPRLIRGYLKGERYRKKTTVSQIVLPDGTPARKA